MLVVLKSTATIDELHKLNEEIKAMAARVPCVALALLTQEDVAHEAFRPIIDRGAARPPIVRARPREVETVRRTRRG